jgi:beta-phosphoglucomutase-like phosphatase (HAD superfamily)
MIHRQQKQKSAQDGSATLARAETRVDVPSVLFDLDGTLIDSVYHHVLAWSEALETAGIVFSQWKIHHRVGMSGKSFVQELLRETVPKKRGVKIEQLEQQHDAKFSRIIPHLQPLPEANELLAHLARKKGSTGDCNHGQSQADYGDPEAAAGSSWHSNPPRR